MQITLSFTDTDDRAEVAALLAHLVARYSTPGAPTITATQTVESLATDAPKTRKPRSTKPALDPVAAYNALAAAAGLPPAVEVEASEPESPVPAEDVVEAPTLEQAVEAAEQVFIRVEEPLIKEPAVVVPAPGLTRNEKIEYTRRLMLARGKPFIDYLGIKPGTPSVAQWSDERVNEVYELALQAPPVTI